MSQEQPKTLMSLGGSDEHSYFAANRVHVPYGQTMQPGVQIVVGGALLNSLTELVSRGINTWDDAPPALKHLHDFLVHGQVLNSQG